MKELKYAGPEDLKGIYNRDDDVTEKINEIIEWINEQENSKTFNK